MLSERKANDLRAVSSLYVERGLFALRYVSANVGVDWPNAEIFISEDMQGRIRLVAAPGAAPGHLAAPGSCCVVLAEAPGVLRVGLRPAHEGGSLEAVIKLEPLDTAVSTEGSTAHDEPTEPIAYQTPQPSRSPQVAFAGLRMIAHVARRGDIEIAAGDWAAGPAAPASIEGIEIAQTGASTPRIEIQALSSGPNQNWTPWTGPGTFVGTRRRAQPLVGLRVRLAGQDTDRWVLSAEAMFLGSALIQREGKDIELIGSFGADPMVGLRLGLKATATPALARPAQVRDNGVKVFRAAGAVR